MTVLQDPVPAPPAPPTPPELPDFDPVIIGDLNPGPNFTEIVDQVAPVVAMFIVMIGLLLVLLPLVRAWARRIETGGVDRELRAELEELRLRLAEVEQHQVRLADFEERLDFAERILTQRTADRIGPA